MLYYCINTPPRRLWSNVRTTTTAAAAATNSHTPGPWMWDDNTLRPANPNQTSSVQSILDAEGGWGFMGNDVHKTWAELDGTAC